MKKGKKALYRNRYRVCSARFKGWDYRRPDSYFVTIVTKHFLCHFGYVEHAKVVLNDLGQFTNDDLMRIDRCCDYVRIRKHVIMPNHVHAIIELTNSVSDYKTNSFGPLLKKSLSSVVNHYKGRVTKFARKKNIKNWAWQSGFYDHIIRNPYDYANCCNYITNNPKKWHKDRFCKTRTLQNK